MPDVYGLLEAETQRQIIALTSKLLTYPQSIFDAAQDVIERPILKHYGGELEFGEEDKNLGSFWAIDYIDSSPSPAGFYGLLDRNFTRWYPREPNYFQYDDVKLRINEELGKEFLELLKSFVCECVRAELTPKYQAKLSAAIEKELSDLLGENGEGQSLVIACPDEKCKNPRVMVLKGVIMRHYPDPSVTYDPSHSCDLSGKPYSLQVLDENH